MTDLGELLGAQDVAGWSFLQLKVSSCPVMVLHSSPPESQLHWKNVKTFILEIGPVQLRENFILFSPRSHCAFPNQKQP